MKKQTHIRLGAAFIIAAALSIPASANDLFLAQGSNCQAIGNRVASQNGATLVSAQDATSGGRAICRIVILKPAQGGQRPKRETIEVPK